MQELEKALKELNRGKVTFEILGRDVDFVSLDWADEVIRKHTPYGWIPVEERLPEEPEENPVFDDKPLELYLVDMGGSYPLRAFWNGKKFTDGWSALDVKAWMP